MKASIRFWSYRAQFFFEWEMFQTEVVEKFKTQILCSVTFSKPYRLWDSVEKSIRAGEAPDDNMEHAHFTLRTYGYERTLRICNTYPLQQLLHERASVLHYAYISCLVTHS
jgi:hypothetical protein